MKQHMETETQFSFRERQILGHKPDLTTTEAAQIMGCSENHIVKQCQDGALPHWRHPGAAQERRIPREEVLTRACNEIPWIEEICPQTLILGISSRTYDMAHACVCEDMFSLGIAAGCACIDRVHIDANGLGIRRGKAIELRAIIRDALRMRMGDTSKLAKMPKITVEFRKEPYRRGSEEYPPVKSTATTADITA